MAGPLQNPFMYGPPAGGAGFYDHQIASSLRNSAAQDGNLTFTAGTPTSSTTFTMSYWVKRYNTSGGGTDNLVFTTGTGGGTYLFWGFSTAYFDLQPAGGNFSGSQMKSNNAYRDTSAWYHHVLTFDSTNSTQADRLKVYVNGERITSWSTEDVTAGIGASEAFSFINQSGVVQAFGGLSGKGHGTVGADVQMAEIVFNDGQAYGPDSYGETKNGVWIPKDPSGLTFGNNGYYLKMKSGAIGTDSSGNGNTFTVANIAAHDVMLDSPTFNSSSNGGNFATIGPLWKTSDMTFSEGNLKWTCSTNQRGLMSNWAVPIGTKAYWEYIPVTFGGNTSNGDESWIGINQGIAALVGGERGGKETAYAYGTSNGYKTILNSASSYGATIRANDVVGVAVDRVNHTINFSKNGSWQGTFAISATMDLFPFIGSGGGTSSATGTLNFGADGTFAGTVTAGGNADENGYGNFLYTPPSGFLALCSGNLSAAGADPAEEKQPVNNYFQAITYTGDGNNGHSLTTKLAAASFWGKNRATGAGTPTRWWNTTGNNFGTGAELYVQFDQASYGASSSTYQGVSNISATNVDVGNVGYINVGSSSYVAYLHGVAGADAVTDTSGDIDSVRFTDADAGISIMDYTGSGTNGHTVPHGLGVKPSFVIIKNSTNSNSSAWRVWSDAYGDYNDYGVLNTSAAWQTSSGIFTADPTTTMLPLASGATQNNSSQTYMAWVFANTEGMVKAGTYVGNGDGSDGTFVYTGFRPAFLMVKKTTSNNWRIQDNARDPYNPAYHMLVPNSNAPEDAYTDGTDYNDFLSNGFKLARGGDAANWNASGSTYIYLAFAEMPFKYATAR
jgi:hypothetical protein